METIATLIISLKADGGIEIDMPENSPKISYEESEDLIRKAYQRMVENRIINSSVNAIIQAQSKAAQSNTEGA